MPDFAFYIILSLSSSFLLASSLRVLQIYLISILLGLGTFSQWYYFECFIEVHIDEDCHISLALIASQNNTELPYHSKLPVQFGTAYHAESHCSVYLHVYDYAFLQNVFKSLEYHWDKTNGSAVACLTFCPLSEV